MLTVHRWTSAVPMPWKNGGGVTRELARCPQGDEFDWRLSVAEVATDGPFSQFPGIDRLLVLLSGGGMDLTVVETGEVERLRQPLHTHRFAGEMAIDATLVDGPTTDLNLMWRRDRFDASVRHLPLPVGYDPVRRTMLVFVVDGGATLADGTMLRAGDVVETTDGLSLGGTGTVTIFVLEPR